MTPENTSERRGIRSTGGGHGRTIQPFRYPEVHIPQYTPDQLSETERWVTRVDPLWGHRSYSSWLRGIPDAESKRHLLTYYTEKALTEDRLAEEFFAENPQRRAEPLAPGSWVRQRNIYGLYTCQIASAINALRFLGLYDPTRHTEQAFLEQLGGQAYARNYNGVETSSIAGILPTLAPDISLRRSNSVREILEAASNGAAVMIPYNIYMGMGHEGVIPVGWQLRRNGRGALEVQVANSMSDTPEFFSVRSLIRSEVTVVLNPETEENSVLIIERTTPQIESDSTEPNRVRQPIRSVPKAQPIRRGIRSVKKEEPSPERRPIRRPIRRLPKD